MKHFLVMLLLALATISSVAPTAFAAKSNCSYGRPYIAVSNNGEQFTFKGISFCDSDFYRVRVSNDFNGGDGWYVSNSGKSQWTVGENGGFSMTFAKRYMKPGNVLQLITYNSYGQATHTFSKAIPCEQQAMLVLFSDGYSWYEGIETVLNCGQNPVPAPLPPQQDCTMRIARDTYEAGVNVSCTLLDRDAYVQVIDRGTRIPLCQARFRTTQSEVRTCTFPRNPNAMLSYSVELQSGGQTFTANGNIFKDPSFNSAPEAQYTNNTDLAPAVKNQSRDRKRWDVTIGARVVDRDVDVAEGQALIRVELINVSTGAVVATKMANSGDTVQFNLTRAYKKPWIGKAHFVGELNEGENKFMIRVRDAYDPAPQAHAPVELPVVTVRVN